MRMADGGVRVFVVPLRSIGDVGGERVPLLGSHAVSLTVCARRETPGGDVGIGGRVTHPCVT